MTIEIRKPSIPPEVGVETSTFSRLRKRLGNGHRLAAHWAVVPLVFLDALCIAGSMIAAYLVRFELLNYYAPFSREFYRRLVLAATLVWPVIFALFRLYHFERLFGGTREYASVFNACTAGAVGLILCRSWHRGRHLSWVAGYGVVLLPGQCQLRSVWLSPVGVRSARAGGLCAAGARRGGQ